MTRPAPEDYRELTPAAAAKALAQINSMLLEEGHGGAVVYLERHGDRVTIRAEYEAAE